MKIYQVDAFTDKPFRGNPAAVCILESKPTDRWMQDIASEMNLAETAFLLKEGDGYNLRWFTPSSEIELCGHATLASAHILMEKGYIIEGQEIDFYTKSGLLTAVSQDGWIRLNFPATPEKEEKAPVELIEALNIDPLYVGKNIFDYIVEVHNEEIVRNLEPDFTKLLKVDMRGVIVTSRSKDYDFVSRFFAPEVGVFEDPVTGSAHCCLGPYWKSKLGKDELIAYQASSRGGVLRVRVVDDRVLILGKAVTVLEGEIFC